jgi:RimJ/RimL family protein N-acetyltransferase
MPLTARLLIEPLAEVHAEGLFAALDDQSVGAFIGGPDVTTLRALRERIARVNAGPGPEWLPEQWFNAAVALRSDGTIVGRIEATTYGDWAEVAYVFGPGWSGQGYATEAVEWMIEDLHERGFDELWATVDPANAASIRLLGRVGFALAEQMTRPLGSYDEGDLVFRRPPPS